MAQRLEKKRKRKIIDQKGENRTENNTEKIWWKPHYKY